MASYLDEYKALDTVPQQKASLYQYLSDNRSSLGMTPDEEYKFNWGQDALSEDWMNTKAQEIQKNVEAANSTSILRRGLGKNEVAKTPDEEVAEKEADAPTTTAKNPLEVNGGGGDGPTFGGGLPSGTTNNSMGMETSYGWSSEQANKSLSDKFSSSPVKTVVGIALNPVGSLLGYLGSGATKTTTSTQAATDKFDRDNFGVTSADLDAERSFNQSMRDMEAGYSTGSDGGIGGDNGRDHGNSGSAPGGGA